MRSATIPASALRFVPDHNRGGFHVSTAGRYLGRVRRYQGGWIAIAAGSTILGEGSTRESAALLLAR